MMGMRREKKKLWGVSGKARQPSAPGVDGRGHRRRRGEGQEGCRDLLMNMKKTDEKKGDNKCVEEREGKEEVRSTDNCSYRPQPRRRKFHRLEPTFQAPPGRGNLTRTAAY